MSLAQLSCLLAVLLRESQVHPGWDWALLVPRLTVVPEQSAFENVRGGGVI
jgi:hypothetical protein